VIEREPGPAAKIKFVKSNRQRVATGAVGPHPVNPAIKNMGASDDQDLRALDLSAAPHGPPDRPDRAL